jgi:hypothetical protein
VLVERRVVGGTGISGSSSFTEVVGRGSPGVEADEGTGADVSGGGRGASVGGGSAWETPISGGDASVSETSSARALDAANCSRNGGTGALLDGTAGFSGLTGSGRTSSCRNTVSMMNKVEILGFPSGQIPPHMGELGFSKQGWLQEPSSTAWIASGSFPQRQALKYVRSGHGG